MSERCSNSYAVYREPAVACLCIARVFYKGIRDVRKSHHVGVLKLSLGKMRRSDYVCIRKGRGTLLYSNFSGFGLVYGMGLKSLDENVTDFKRKFCV